MKTSKIICTILLCGSTLFLSGQGRSTVKEQRIDSKMLSCQREYNIYLPAGYEKSDKRYPVLYLLHGAWGDHNSWTTDGNMQLIVDQTIASGLSHEMIIIMPNACGQAENKAGKNMGYFNLPDWPYEDFFFNEFIPYIDSTYRTIPTKKCRAIAGLSMGGGGTTIYAQRHPDFFSSAYSISGLLDYDSSNLRLEKEFDKAATETSPVKFLKKADKNDIAKLRSVRWYFDCGDDDFLYKGNIDVYMLMKSKRIPVQFRMRDGAHTWLYWQTALPEILTFCSIGFTK